jgi:hypothetical protein
MADAAGSFIALVFCVERMSRERNELPIGFRASPVVKAKTSLFRTWKRQCHRASRSIIRWDVLLSLSNYYSKRRTSHGVSNERAIGRKETSLSISETRKISIMNKSRLELCRRASKKTVHGEST